MFKSIQINGEDPLFSLSNKKCIWYSQYQAKLKGLIKKIGLNPDNYSSHSFRRRGCSYSFKSGVPAFRNTFEKVNCGNEL